MNHCMEYIVCMCVDVCTCNRMHLMGQPVDQLPLIRRDDLCTLQECLGTKIKLN